MPPLSLPYRRAYRVSLALLVLAATAHCAWEAPATADHCAEAASCSHDEHPTPLAPDPCNGESGCFCRGALPIAATNVREWRSTCQALPSPPEQPLEFAAVFSVRNRRADLWQRPLAYGRHLRALYASLTI